MSGEEDSGEIAFKIERDKNGKMLGGVIKKGKK